MSVQFPLRGGRIPQTLSREIERILSKNFLFSADISELVSKGSRLSDAQPKRQIREAHQRWRVAPILRTAIKVVFQN